MAGEGHVFCLPNPPLVRHQELDPLRLTLVYDDEGRLESETVALADTGAGEDEDEGLASSSFVRDAAGTLRSVEHLQEDPEEVVWEGERIVGRDTAIGGVRFTYDDAGRLLRRSASVGETTLATAYVYGDGRLTRVTRELFEDSEAPVRTTTARFEYDPSGRLTACTLDGGDDPLRVVYEYDGAGRLTGRSAIDPDTRTAAWDWQYRYDCSQPRPDDDDEP
jgi:YD repeat-containing protein